MLVTTNPWLNRLPVGATDEELRDRMSLPIQQIKNLHLEPPWAAKDLLDQHLKSTYVPTAQGLKLARRVMETGYAHSLINYRSVGDFVQRVMNPTSSRNLDPATWMIAGDAGSGKSITLNAIVRLLGDASHYKASDDLDEYPIIGGIFITLSPQSTMAELFSQISSQIGYRESIDKVNEHSKRALRNELYKRGVLFIVLDESQVAAQGKTAGASYVKNLVLIRDLGVPLIFACNYSMVHGMLGQHAQNQQRLLVSPFHFQSHTIDDPDFAAMLNAYVEACNGLLEIDVMQGLLEIHRLCDGRGRLLRFLIVIAYHMQRVGSSNWQLQIGLDELIAAYRSDAFVAMREEVEAIKKHRLQRSDLRSDLMYPLSTNNDNTEAARQETKRALQASAARANLRDFIPNSPVISSSAYTIPPLEIGAVLETGSKGDQIVSLQGKSFAPKKSPTRRIPKGISESDVDDAWK